MMISQKNTKVKDYIKEMKLIKFYAESVANYELLIFMTAKPVVIPKILAVNRN